MKKNTIGVIYIVLVTIIAFAPTLFSGNVPLPTDLTHAYLLGDTPMGFNTWVRDSIVQLYPNAHVAFEGWKQGTTPFFNEYIFKDGMQQLATGQSMAASPLILAIPFYSSSLLWFAHSIVLLSLVAGINMFIYLRSKRFSLPIALLGAIAFQFSGPMIAWTSWGTIVGVIAWMPLGLYGIDRYIESNRRRWLVVLTLIHYCMLTAGHLQFFMYAVVLLTIYTVYRVATTHTFTIKTVQKQVRSILLFLGVNIAIASALLIPFLRVLNTAHRSTLSDSSYYEPANLLQFWKPTVWGDHTAYTGPLNIVESFSFVGTVTVIAATLAILYTIFKFIRPTGTKRAALREHLFWVGLALLTMLYMMLPFASNVLGSIVPLFNSLPPYRALFVVCVSLIILACIYLQHVHDVMHRYSNTVITTGVFATLTIMTTTQLLFLFNSYQPQQGIEPIANPPEYVKFIMNDGITKPLVYSEVSPLNLYSLYGIKSLFGYDTMYSEEYFQLIKANSIKRKSHRNILNARITDITFLREQGVDYIISKKEWELDPTYTDTTNNIAVYRLSE